MENRMISMEEMYSKIKTNLHLKTCDYDLLIEDLIREACDYCNLSTGHIPEELESIIRKKVQGIVDYEAVKGTGFVQDIASIKEGDGSISYVTGPGSGATREEIYHFTERDKSILKRHRRLRGYA